MIVTFSNGVTETFNRKGAAFAWIVCFVGDDGPDRVAGSSSRRDLAAKEMAAWKKRLAPRCDITFSEIATLVEEGS